MWQWWGMLLYRSIRGDTWWVVYFLESGGLWECVFLFNLQCVVGAHSSYKSSCLMSLPRWSSKDPLFCLLSTFQINVHRNTREEGGWSMTIPIEGHILETDGATTRNTVIVLSFLPHSYCSYRSACNRGGVLVYYRGRGLIWHPFCSYGNAAQSVPGPSGIAAPKG